MPAFSCIRCEAPIHVDMGDVAIPILPDIHACGRCGTPNMLSRRTVLLALVPSIVAGLAAAFANAAWVHVSPPFAAILVGYALGVVVGFALATALGQLAEPYGPRA